MANPKPTAEEKARRELDRRIARAYREAGKHEAAALAARIRASKYEAERRAQPQ